ncbi:MAG: hypothetical protein NUV80_05580 [Candidatus Berkelbacteria bacterium]|nr:hypothetical protein [Candidatus Berkelbacteria bacterium]
MTWFEKLTGCREESPEHVREHLTVDGDRLRSIANGHEWRCGTLETPSLSELRQRARLAAPTRAATSVRELVADVKVLHCDTVNSGAMFQVASQFNLLEMISPQVAPEDGIGRYETDLTQGPACAVAAGAGTIYRNYFVPVNGAIGQTERNQIDCLADIGSRLGNSGHDLWRMVNGYAVPSSRGLQCINEQLKKLDEPALDEIRGLLRIGVQRDTQVTLNDSTHAVTQSYCSAMPVSYTEYSPDAWAPLAILILEAAYEATICAAIENTSCTGNNRLYLTLLGGGAFGNKLDWILSAIYRAISLYRDCGLDVAIVSYGRSNPAVQQLVQKLSSLI